MRVTGLRKIKKIKTRLYYFPLGIDSIYTNGDRRFKFKCCNDEGFDHTDCHQSHLLNLPGQDFEFKVDRDKRFYMTGISSFFNPEKR